MLLRGKCDGIDKKEKDRRKIQEEANDDPKFLALVNEQNRRILYLLI